MDELTIRRYKGFNMTRYPEAGKAEKQTASQASQSAARSTGLNVSGTLQQLMTKVSRTEAQIRESHRTLQTGEAVLDEVQNSLKRMADLAKEAAAGNVDRAAIQKELEQLRDEVDRMLRSAAANGEKLFLDDADGLEENIDAILKAVANEETSGEAEGIDALPDWLLKGLTQGAPAAKQLLSALGLDETASAADILAAIADQPLEDNPVAGYLAALYLGAVISGHTEDGTQTDAWMGLRMLLEQVAQGVPLDEALEALTNGEFTSMADFESQFLDGTAPGLDAFLTHLLLSGNQALLTEVPFLANFDGMQMDLLSALMDALQSSGLEMHTGERAASEADPDPAARTPDPSSAAGMPAETAAAEATRSTTAVQYGTVRITGRDLSGVTFDAASNVLTVSGTADVTIQGTGQESPAVVLNGSGTVTLRAVHTPTLTISTPAAHVASTGGNVLGEIRLPRDAVLTLSGNGRLEIGRFHANHTNLVRLTSGAVVIQQQQQQQQQTGTSLKNALALPIVLEGPASLAVQAVSVHVTAPDGKALEPFDILWKTLLPGWNSISSLMVDGKQARMELLQTQHPARLWMEKGDHGYPIHTVVIRGRDKAGQPQTRYAYLRWNQRAAAFQEVSLYPNPFRVSGGEENVDWIYEEESHTLRILTSQVTAVSGGAGMDANQSPFSGRIALTDQLGTASLSLGGVDCRVSSGRAFSLGRGNDVTLILKRGADNHFESGAGCAGISLLDGTALCIDCAAPHSSRDPAGTLSAAGGAGGAGIGRDGRGSRDRTSHIFIRGGVITAVGNGGGAGIGAGKRSAMGAITITGGTVNATGGKGGGAGIGGALGAPVGDIRIEGGIITAAAAEHAAAIGAGVQGESGDILITGNARIKKAVGGDPGADIGACLFGGCGDVRITGSADIGAARLRPRAGVPLRMGEDTVTLPQFRLSARSLRLDRLSVLTREYAQSAINTLDTDRRWVAQIQAVYSALYNQLEQSRRLNTHQYVNLGLLRDSDEANNLLKDTRQSISLASAMRSHSRQQTEALRRLFQ